MFFVDKIHLAECFYRPGRKRGQLGKLRKFGNFFPNFPRPTFRISPMPNSKTRTKFSAFLKTRTGFSNLSKTRKILSNFSKTRKIFSNFSKTRKKFSNFSKTRTMFSAFSKTRKIFSNFSKTWKMLSLAALHKFFKETKNLDQS